MVSFGVKVPGGETFGVKPYGCVVKVLERGFTVKVPGGGMVSRFTYRTIGAE